MISFAIKDKNDDVLVFNRRGDVISRFSPFFGNFRLLGYTSECVTVESNDGRIECYDEDGTKLYQISL